MTVVGLNKPSLAPLGGGKKNRPRAASAEPPSRAQSTLLSPRDPMLYRAHAARAYAHLLLEEFDEAISWGLRAIEENPSYNVTYRALAVAYAYSGRMDEARNMVDRIRRLTPGITMGGLPEWVIFRQSGRLDFILDGLRKAGLPE